MKKTILMLLLMTIILITGCGKQSVEPVAINEHTDKCEICSMAVKDDQFATEIILENGKAIVFDDLGCMYKWLEENSEKKVDAQFVRDFHSSEWIEMEQATYVYDPWIKTPMAYNVISFENKSDAEIFISENKGTLLNYDELMEHSWERNKEMMKKMKMMKEHGDHKEMEGMEETEESDTSH